jgi:hypothetical protein
LGYNKDMSDTERAVMAASAGSEEELRPLAYHPSSRVLLKVLSNKNVSEELVLIVAGRRNITPEVLESVYNDVRWRQSYRVMLALCKNPKTPQKISLSLLKSVRIFDQAELTRNQHVPINVRMRAEAAISEKMLSMPLGIKMSLARKASSNVIIKLMEDGMKEVVPLCLENPYMTEAVICKIINMKKIASHVIRRIADHPKWSSRYDVQWSLIRNNNAPLIRVVQFLRNIKTNDLRELYAAPEVPASTKPFIFRELADRGVTDFK